MPAKLFWKIIMDSEKRATILVTQHTPNQCYNREGICSDTGSYIEDWYSGNGCTYLCPVNDEMLKMLDLPEMEISGTLGLEIPKNSSPGFIYMLDFSKNTSFLEALLEVDPIAYTAVVKDMADY